ncbi:hypothetical protein JMJ58_03715 [Haloterrigena salifodinae]|uniref:Uncharacterized protein n=1 Tax=Haloterrigena salifodinae TaxID=2675099 RepID=A0A8T8E3A6_9EURY|nr:hypothetical protein [Haloterrigena salifodinae]QRV16016.1 hypothetical protein JMJ58_03715 [Haloterrigena salifodinae]
MSQPAPASCFGFYVLQHIVEEEEWFEAQDIVDNTRLAKPTVNAYLKEIREMQDREEVEVIEVRKREGDRRGGALEYRFAV